MWMIFFSLVRSFVCLFVCLFLTGGWKTIAWNSWGGANHFKKNDLDTSFRRIMQKGRWIKKRACKDFVKLSLNVSFQYPKRKAEKGEFGAITFCAVSPLYRTTVSLIRSSPSLIDLREYPYNSPPPPARSHRWLMIDISPLRCSRQTFTNQKWHKGCVYLRTCITTLFFFNLLFLFVFFFLLMNETDSVFTRKLKRMIQA